MLAGRPLHPWMCRLELLESFPIIRLQWFLSPVYFELCDGIGKLNCIGDIERQIAIDHQQMVGAGPSSGIGDKIPVGSQSGRTISRPVRQWDLRAEKAQFTIDLRGWPGRIDFELVARLAANQIIL